MKQKNATLSGRSIVEITGTESETFLSGLITNSLPEPDSGVFAALLTPQGKILFDFFIIRQNSNFLIDISSGLVNEFIKKLTFYKLRTDVNILDHTNEYKVVAIWNAETIPEGITFQDPRLPDLGYRCITQSSDYRETEQNPLDETAYIGHRVTLGIPEGGSDYEYGESFPHDACYDYLNGVDFRKGCYVGQEVVSRMKHRGTARKRIVRVHGAGPLPETGTDIIADEQLIGRLGTVSKNSGIGLVRIDRATKAIANRQKITAKEVSLNLSVPDWADYKL